jgi:3-polyprenyl-4-hydroxybenzoate decarboxylase
MTGTSALPPTGARVLLGVSGGIAAYKACEVLRGLTEAGHRVRVVPTQAALRFVGEATWAALSGEPVATDVWAAAHEVPHVALGRTADLVVVVPATADLMAKAAQGRADDLLTNALLTATCPVVYVPAMHTEMWEHPATRENVATLRRRGVVVLDPAVGRLTGGSPMGNRIDEKIVKKGIVRSMKTRPGATLAEQIAERERGTLPPAPRAPPALSLVHGSQSRSPLPIRRRHELVVIVNHQLRFGARQRRIDAGKFGFCFGSGGHDSSQNRFSGLVWREAREKEQVWELQNWLDLQQGT